MKNVNQSDACSFCDKNFNYILRHYNENILLCEDCARELYRKLGHFLVPKGLPNMIMRATNNSTIKSFEDLQNDDSSKESECKFNKQAEVTAKPKSKLNDKAKLVKISANKDVKVKRIKSLKTKARRGKNEAKC